MGGELRVGGKGGGGGGEQWISGEVMGKEVPQAEEGDVRERGAGGIQPWCPCSGSQDSVSGQVCDKQRLNLS